MRCFMRRSRWHGGWRRSINSAVGGSSQAWDKVRCKMNSQRPTCRSNGVAVGWKKSSRIACGLGTRSSELFGSLLHYPESQIGPKPVQPGGPPIVIGGIAPAAIERAARIADGLNPVGVSFEMLDKSINTFRNAARAAGRDPDALMIVVRLNGKAMARIALS